MSTLTCQNGLPLLEPGDRRLHTWTIPASNGVFRLTYSGGVFGFLLAYVALWFSERVQDVTHADSHHKAIVDYWGLAIRPIRGQTHGYSNHGGYAEDLRASAHPLARSGTFMPWQRLRIAVLLRRLGGCIRWGGNYHGRKDEMHWEIPEHVSLAMAAPVARRLAKSSRGRRILAANPTQKALVLAV